MSGSHKHRRKNFRTPEDVLQSRRMKSSHFAQSTTMKDAPKVLPKGRLSSVRRSASPKAQHKNPSQKINSHKTKAHSLDAFPNLTSPGGKKTPPGPSQGSVQRPKSITSVKTPSLGCKVKVIPIKKCVSFAATPTISSSVSSYQSKSTNPKLREVGAEDVGEMARVGMIGGQDTSISEKGLGRSPQAENVDDEVQQQLIIEKDLVLSSQRQKRDLLDKNRNKQADLRQRSRVTLCEDNTASYMTRKNSVSKYNEMLTPQDGRESPNDNDSKLAARAQKEPNTTAEDAEAQFITRGPKCFDSLIENPIDEDDPNHASAIVRDSEVRNIPVEPHVKNFCNEQADLINDQGDQTASPLTAGNIRPVPQEEMQRDKLSHTRVSGDMYEPEHPFREALGGGPLQGSMLPESLYAMYLKDEMNFPMNSTYRLQYPLNKSTKTREMLLSLTAERQPYHLRSRRTPRQLTPSLWRPHKATIFYLPENQHHSIKESEEKPTQQQTGVALAPIVHGGYYDARVPGHLKYGSMSYDDGIREQQFPFEHRLATSEDLAREMKRVRKFHDCRKMPPSVGSRTSETRIQPPSRIHYHMNGWFPCSSTSVLRTKYIDAVSDLKRYWFDEWHKEVTLRNSVNQNTQYVMRGRRNKGAHSESGPHHSLTEKEIRSSQKLTQYSEPLPVQTLPNKSLRTSPVTCSENFDTEPEQPESDVGDTAGFEQPKQFGIPRLRLDRLESGDLNAPFVSPLSTRRSAPSLPSALPTKKQTAAPLKTQPREQIIADANCECRACSKAAHWISSEGCTCYPEPGSVISQDAFQQHFEINEQENLSQVKRRDEEYDQNQEELRSLQQQRIQDIPLPTQQQQQIQETHKKLMEFQQELTQEVRQEMGHVKQQVTQGLQQETDHVKQMEPQEQSWQHQQIFEDLEKQGHGRPDIGDQTGDGYINTPDDLLTEKLNLPDDMIRDTPNADADQKLWYPDDDLKIACRRLKKRIENYGKLGGAVSMSELSVKMPASETRSVGSTESIVNKKLRKDMRTKNEKNQRSNVPPIRWEIRRLDKVLSKGSV